MNELDRRLAKVAVIGAGGKMGSGISLLLLQEMSWIELSKTGQLGSGVFQIELIDQSEKALSGLYQYLKTQLRRHAEKIIQKLREFWKHDSTLVSNGEIIDAYIDRTLAMARLGKEFSSARDSLIIFEAISEDFQAKIALFNLIESFNPSFPWYFTNTSSIPIHALAEGGNIEGRLIGFHFYNPPAVQKLVELIVPKEDPQNLKLFGATLGRRLNKIVVDSHDIAGFIGNGQFIREILYALSEVGKMGGSLKESIHFYDSVTRDLLIRPMGIFQLIDYVGLDVVSQIMSVMAQYLPDPSFMAPLLDQFLSNGIKGGQFPDGRQRDGIFSYREGKPAAIYSFETNDYQPLQDLSSQLGPYPSKWKKWKDFQKERELEKGIQSYFKELFALNTPGASAAYAFLIHSRGISNRLVEDGVAEKLGDVTTVVKHGFFHLYGPDLPLECEG